MPVQTGFKVHCVLVASGDGCIWICVQPHEHLYILYSFGESDTVVSDGIKVGKDIES